jgi:hypothetical protein
VEEGGRLLPRSEASSRQLLPANVFIPIMATHGPRHTKKFMQEKIVIRVEYGEIKKKERKTKKTHGVLPCFKHAEKSDQSLRVYNTCSSTKKA